MPDEYAKAEWNVHADKGGSMMEAAIVYIGVDAREMDSSLDPEYWDVAAGPAPIHVSLKSPRPGNADTGPDDSYATDKDFIMIKRKIYLVPTFLSLSDDDSYDFYYEDEGCNLAWDPQKNTVVAKCQSGVYPLIPSD